MWSFVCLFIISKYKSMAIKMHFDVKEEKKDWDVASNGSECAKSTVRWEWNQHRFRVSLMPLIQFPFRTYLCWIPTASDIISFEKHARNQNAISFSWSIERREWERARASDNRYVHANNAKFGHKSRLKNFCLHWNAALLWNLKPFGGNKIGRQFTNRTDNSRIIVHRAGYAMQLE